MTFDVVDIRCVSIDLDGTLVDFRRALSQALERAAFTIRETPGITDTPVTAGLLTAIRNEVAAALPLATHEEIRRRAFQATLAHLGRPDEALADRIYRQYMADRFRLCRPFADAEACLAALRKRYELGIISNGNSYPERCGLTGVFDWAVLSQEVGVRKPEKAIFAQAVVRAGCTPREIVHVGDDPDEDICGALQAGLQAIWLNRDARPWPRGSPPCPTVPSLTELAALLAAG